jgi:SNF2 family DNA or RNA helicase
MAKAIEIDGKELLVRPSKYPSDEVKQVLGGRWDRGKSAWRLPPTSLNVVTLTDWYGKEFLNGAPWVVKNLALTDWGFTGWGTLAHLTAPETQQRAYSHPHWDELYDFQKEAVEYMVCNPHRGCILALSPGLGKSPTSIVAADVLQASKILVVAPLTLARNWLAEWDKWSQLYRSWSRATAGEKDPKSECVVTNFETLFQPVFVDENGNESLYPIALDGHEIRGASAQKQWIQTGPHKRNPKTGKPVPVRQRKVEPRKSYFDTDWDIIIIDESVLLKNRRAVKVDVLGKMAQYAHQVWLLSGSPTSKYRNDLYSQVKTIMPRGFTSYWRFTDFFCTVERNQWGWQVTGDRVEHDPQSYLRDFLFVRNQKDVLEELPDYIYDPIEIELEPAQRKAFTELLNDWSTELESGKKISVDIKLAQMTRLQQITSNLVNIGGQRVSAKENLLATLLEQNDIEFPMIVWCWWVPTAQSVYDRIYDEFPDIEVDLVTGDMKSSEKDDAIDAYRAGDIDVLVLQMGVGKWGHNLQDTKTVYYMDRSFNTDAYIQSLRRVKRIGLKHRPRLIVPRSKNSSDPLVELNLAGKMQSIAKVANHDLRELLQSLGSGMVPWSMEYPDIVSGEQI